MKYIHPQYLTKNESAAAYKKYAETGMGLMFPVRIGGKTHMSDTGIPYHSTIKLFDTSKDKPEHAHEVASRLSMNPPDSKEVHLEPATLKSRDGHVLHVIKLHGPHADVIKEHHGAFSHLGYQEKYQFAPHITVDKPTWDHIVNSGHKTAHDAGIQFMPAELRHGHKVVSSYKPKVAAPAGGDAHKEDKLAASEDLQKGAIRNIGIAAVMGAALATSTPAKTPTHQASQYSSQKMLSAIAHVESSGGRNTKHAAGGGAIHGAEHAYGKFGLMPETIRETIGMHRDLSAKHGKATMLRGKDLHHYMQDNPGLEDVVATKHLKRLEHHFGRKPADIGYSWLQGVSGTYKAKRNNVDTDSHWHAKKVKDAYLKGK